MKNFHRFASEMQLQCKNKLPHLNIYLFLVFSGASTPNVGLLKDHSDDLMRTISSCYDIIQHC